MTLNNPTNQREGCIATVPPQSARSCELVIEALARELAAVTDALGRAWEGYICKRHAPEEARYECDYWQSWARAHDFLVDLREDWPHLDLDE